MTYNDIDLVLPQHRFAEGRSSHGRVVSMDARNVGMVKTVPNDGDAPIGQVEVDNEPSYTRNFMMLCERLAYCKAGYEALDDPIARPLFALTRAIQGKHSLGFTEQEVLQIAQAYLSPEERKLTQSLAASNAKASATQQVGPMKERLDALLGKLSQKRAGPPAASELGSDLPAGPFPTR